MDGEKIIDPIEEQQKEWLETATREELVNEIETLRNALRLGRQNETFYQDTILRLAMKMVGTL